MTPLLRTFLFRQTSMPIALAVQHDCMQLAPLKSFDILALYKFYILLSSSSSSSIKLCIFQS